MRQTLSALALVALVAPVGADDKKPDPSKSDLPVQAKLVAKKTTYKLDVDAKQLKELLKAAEASGKYPPAPAVEMALELTNKSDKDVQVWTGGDPVKLQLTLKGPGVEVVKPQLFFTQEFRLPKPVTIAPGKSVSIPITKLSYGHRGVSEMVFWTEPGEYELTAALESGINPPPKGAKAEEDGFAKVKFVSEPIKIKVEGK